MPSEDDQMIGHKYPFNACEILCSPNGLNMNKLLNLKDESKNEDLENCSYKKDDDEVKVEENENEDEKKRRKKRK